MFFFFSSGFFFFLLCCIGPLSNHVSFFLSLFSMHVRTEKKRKIEKRRPRTTSHLDTLPLPYLLTSTHYTKPVDAEYLRGTATSDECQPLFAQYKQCLSVRYTFLFLSPHPFQPPLLQPPLPCLFVSSFSLCSPHGPTSLLLSGLLPSTEINRMGGFFSLTTRFSTARPQRPRHRQNARRSEGG